jgi:protein-tyrosine phosphatase
MNTSRIYDTIWQGAQPPTGPKLREFGFDVLVLCATEFQPPANQFPGVTVIHAPNDDSDMTSRDQLDTVLQAARKVAEAARADKNVLVTCYLGLNRSGLVTALALHLLTGWPGWKCAKTVKLQRPYALSNQHFVRLIERLRAKAA